MWCIYFFVWRFSEGVFGGGEKALNQVRFFSSGKIGLN